MTHTTKKKKGFSWGVGMAVLYGTFVLFILAFVIFASTQNFDLVEKDYYAKELAYQDQIERIARTKALLEKPKVEYHAEDKTIVLHFPESFTPDNITGTLHLFRPSNARWDKTIPISLDNEGQQVIPAEWLIKGKWTIKLNWSDTGVEYYHEDMLIMQ